MVENGNKNDFARYSDTSFKPKSSAVFLQSRTLPTTSPGQEATGKYYKRFCSLVSGT